AFAGAGEGGGAVRAGGGGGGGRRGRGRHAAHPGGPLAALQRGGAGDRGGAQRGGGVGASCNAARGGRGRGTLMAALRRRDARMRAEALVGGGPNMTPMVDVILVILIFFMATTVIVGEEWFLGAGLTRQAPHEAREGAGADEAQEDPFEMPPPRFTLRLSVGEGGTVVSGLGEPAIVGSPGAM